MPVLGRLLGVFSAPSPSCPRFLWDPDGRAGAGELVLGRSPGELSALSSPSSLRSSPNCRGWDRLGGVVPGRLLGELSASSSCSCSSSSCLRSSRDCDVWDEAGELVLDFLLG